MLPCYLLSVIRLTWRYPALPLLFLCAKTWIANHAACAGPFTPIAGLAIAISGSSFMDHECRIS